MALAARELRNGFSISNGLTRNVVIRRYRISGLPIGVGNVPEFIFGADGFPDIGDGDAVYDNAICVDRRLDTVLRVEGTDPAGNIGAIAYATAVFRSNNPFTGGPVPISQFVAEAKDTIEVPAFEFIAPGLYDKTPLRAERPKGIRIETRFLAGNDVAEVQDKIMSVIGGLFDLDNNDKFVQFIGGSAIASGLGRITVRYRFWTNGDIKEVPIGPLTDVPIPYLPPLHEYVVKYAGATPVVSVRLPDDFHFVYNNAALPGLG